MKERNGNDEFLQKRKARQRKIRKRRFKVFFAVFTAVLLMVGIILSLTVLFPIKNITAKGSSKYSPEVILSACGVDKGDNIFTVSEKRTLKLLREQLPFIDSVEFDRTLPDTLNIKVTDAKENVCYMADGKFYTVSKKGWVLESYDKQPKNITLIICDGAKCALGQKLGFDDGANDDVAHDIIKKLEENKLSVDYIDISDPIFLKAKIEDRFIVNFGSSTDLEPKVKHLVTMLSEMEDNATGTVDLSSWNSQNRQGFFKPIDIK